MKNGFTLAETLITLGIIGIVSAITLPTMILSHRNKVLHTRFLKAYSILSSVHNNMINDYGGVYSNFIYEDVYYVYDSNAYNQKNAYINAFSKYLIVKDCKFTNAYINCSGKAPSEFKYKTYDGSTRVMNDFFHDRALVTSDGMLFFFGGQFRNSSIYIDTNGSKQGPNRLGFDLFAFDIDNNDKIIKPKNIGGGSNGGTEDGSRSDVNICTGRTHNNKFNGYGCSEYALQDKNPDNSNLTYWKTLPW